MRLVSLVEQATDKTRFGSIEDYVEFARSFLGYTAEHLQAVIVSRNETHYRFWQFRKEGHYNLTRPINANLMFTAEEADQFGRRFIGLLDHIREPSFDIPANRECLNRAVYTLQQCIGAALDALPSGKANTARKLNGDLFERLIFLLLVRIGVDCTTRTIRIPIEVAGMVQFHMSYQHDLIIKEGDSVKIIGSVKTSSKDRLDKIFVDKFLLARLTGKAVPHVAIFLNDVQRKVVGKKTAPTGYGINATFLPGHFKGYTVKLNPLDGVYYCDLRPNMRTQPILREQIRTFDHFVFADLWELIGREAIDADIVGS